MVNECPNCEDELEGGMFGDNAYCEKCNITFETDYYRHPRHPITSCLSGIEYKGRVKMDDEAFE